MRLFFLIPFLGLFLNCQKQPKITIQATYAEAADPAPSQQDWGHLPSGLQAAMASINQRFVKSEIPKIESTNAWEKTSWRGERVSGQMVLWSKDSMTKVRAEITDFTSDQGAIIPAKAAQLRFVKYVITDEFAGGCGYRKPQDFAASLAADALDHVTSYAIKANTSRPLWISMDTPQDAQPGTYHSKIILHIEGQKTQEFNLKLHVINKTLPPPDAWKFHLDLWQNPYAVARYNNVKPWSKAHWNLLKPLMKRLANAGQKVITVSLNKRPWNGQTYDPFQAMIRWEKKKDGHWAYDYTVFDNWVQFMMDLGIKSQISCYSMVPWGNIFYYFDAAQNKEIKIKAAPGTLEYENLWVPFLKDFKAHLETKGWNKITRMAMDERGPKEMKAMFKILNKYAPEFGASFADNHKSYKLYPNELKDMSVAFGHPVDAVDLKTRRQKGYVSTFYVCCSDGYPNVFTFSPPAEGIVLGWYAMAADFDGLLRWAYNSWVKNPLQDSRFRAWPAGDTYLVYPGNRSSIRFETLREGIQDAEKIRLLRDDFKRRNKTEQLIKLNKIVATFDQTKAPEDLNDMLSNAKKTLNQLALE